MVDKKTEEALRKLEEKLKYPKKKLEDKPSKKITEEKKEVDEDDMEEIEQTLPVSTPQPIVLGNSDASNGLVFENSVGQQMPIGPLEQSVADVEVNKDSKKEEKLYSDVRDSYEDSKRSSVRTNPIMSVQPRENFDSVRLTLNGGLDSRRIGMIKTENMGDEAQSEIYEVQRAENNPQDLFDLNANNKIRKYQR